MGNNLQSVHEIRDLGVIIDNKLNFNSHYDHTVKKSAQMIGFIKRNTKGFKHVRTKIILYNALVRSHLEFASVIWNPFYAAHSQRLENIQRHFTRHLAFVSPDIFHKAPYAERLTHFNMVSLRNRRITHDLCSLHKIISGQTRCSSLIDRISLSVPFKYPRKPISNIFNTPFSRTNLGLNSPLTRMCKQYSLILQKIPDLDPFGDSLSIYKSKLHKYFLNTQNPQLSKKVPKCN